MGPLRLRTAAVAALSLALLGGSGERAGATETAPAALENAALRLELDLERGELAVRDKKADVWWVSPGARAGRGAFKGTRACRDFRERKTPHPGMQFKIRLLDPDSCERVHNDVV